MACLVRSDADQYSHSWRSDKIVWRSLPRIYKWYECDTIASLMDPGTLLFSLLFPGPTLQYIECKVFISFCDYSWRWILFSWHDYYSLGDIHRISVLKLWSYGWNRGRSELSAYRLHRHIILHQTSWLGKRTLHKWQCSWLYLLTAIAEILTRRVPISLHVLDTWWNHLELFHCLHFLRSRGDAHEESQNRER